MATELTSSFTRSYYSSPAAMALVKPTLGPAIHLSVAPSEYACADGVTQPFIRIVAAQSPEPPVRAQRRTSLLAPHNVPIDRDAHRVPGSQYVILAIWLAFLLVLYLWTRIVCLLGVPPDCTADDDIVRVMNDFQFLLLAGFVLAFMAGLHWPDRFQYVFDFKHREGPCPRGVTFLLTSFLTVGFWGCLDLVPGLSSFALTTGGIRGWHILLIVLLAVGAVWLVAWHFRRAFAKNSWAGFLAYVLSRLVILTFYGAYVFASRTNRNVEVHFHHYLIGFLIASLAEFNHPISLVLLAIGTGLFVQGVAAYDADPIISHPMVHIYNHDKSVKSPWMSKEAADWTLSHCKHWDI